MRVDIRVVAWMVMSLFTGIMADQKRCIMYLTGQHNVVPTSSNLLDSITHVILAFMRSEQLHEPEPNYSLFTTVPEVREKFSPKTKIMIAVGGWGDSLGFEDAARTNESRKQWARRVNDMLEATGADGVDIDWEYPGGNRDDYKTIPNDQRTWEIPAFVSLLEELRAAIGPSKLLSIAVPAMERDLMAFTSTSMPRIVAAVDFMNVMTYDMMNRRDTTVQHHSGVKGSQEALQRYIYRGANPEMLNMGLGYYVKWFMTQECDPENPIGCATQPLEDPETGGDLGRTAAFSWHDEVPADLAKSFHRAVKDGYYDADGSYGSWDVDDKRWWSFDTPKSITSKISSILPALNIGGVFAWGLGEDAPQFRHLEATLHQLNSLSDVQRDEL